jgi:hypothetical protein
MTQNLTTFEERVKRVDPDFKPTVWRKWQIRPRGKYRVPLARTSMVLLFCYCTLTITKIVMESQLGPQGFDAKVAQLSAGSDASKIAARLLWRDPVMAYVEDKFL